MQIVSYPMETICMNVKTYFLEKNKKNKIF